MKRHIKIALSEAGYGANGAASLMIDDFPIGNDVMAFDLKLANPGDAQLTLKLIGSTDVDAWASVRLTPMSERMLVSLGWTPPTPPDQTGPKFDDTMPHCTMIEVVAGYVRKCELGEHGLERWHRDGVFEWQQGGKDYVVRIDRQQK
jgi:hypothetical protein